MKKLIILITVILFSGILSAQNTFKYGIVAPSVTLPSGDVKTQLDNKLDKTSGVEANWATEEQAEIISKSKNGYGNNISNMAGYVMGTVFPVGFSGYSSLTSVTMTSGRMWFCTIMLYKPTVVTGYKFNIITAGVYTADAVNGLSIHSMALNLSTEVSGSQLNNANMWTVSGVNTKALTTPITLPAGEYKIYVLYHSSAQTTAPILSGLTLFDIGNYTANSWGGNNALIGYFPLQTTLSTTQVFSNNYTAISAAPLIELY